MYYGIGFFFELVQRIILIGHRVAVRIGNLRNISRLIVFIRIRFAVYDVVLDTGVGVAVNVGVVFNRGVKFGCD